MLWLCLGSRGRRFESARSDKQKGWSHALLSPRTTAQALLALLKVDQKFELPTYR
jgi:hypothetical protein